MMRIAAATVAGFLAAACGGESSSDADTSPPALSAEEASQDGQERYLASAEDAASLSAIAESFVKLSLAVGEHDPAFVDAYHGPDEWA